MKVYLDNSVIGRLVDIERGIKPASRMLQEDMAVLPDILLVSIEKGIQLCASEETAIEIEKLRQDMPQLTNALIEKLHSFTLLPIRHAIGHDSSHYNDMDIVIPEDNGSRVDSLANELKAFLLKKTKITREEKRQAVEWDSYHLAVCKDNDCGIFLTCDYASIWAYRRFLKRLFSIEVRRPVEFFKEVV